MRRRWIPDYPSQNRAGGSAMNIVQGKIIAKGTGAPISDLQVVIYDLDPAQLEQLHAPGNTADDNIASFLPAGSPYRVWIDFPGDRIGSVLTDARGRFRLEYEDFEFKGRNTERRPDLVLFVLAPDESSGSTGMGTSPLQRILHLAMVPRANAGKVESYSIALLPSLLDRFGIRYPGMSGHSTAVADHLAAHLRKSRELQVAATAALRPFVAARSAEITRKNTARGRAWRWLAPTSLATGSALFKPPDVPLGTLPEKALVEGVRRLEPYRAKATLRLTPLDLSKLGLVPRDLEEGRAVEISLCDLLAMKGFGTSLVRVRTLLDDLRAQHQARGALPTATGTPQSPGPTPAPPPLDPAPLLRERILGQIADLPSFDRPDRSSPVQELEKIKQTINRLELTGGPANVAAFQDFHSLQVAHRHIWTAAFDERLREQAAELYDATVRLHEEYGLEVPDIDAVNDVNQFREFLSGLGGALEYAAVVPIDPDVRACFPQLDLWTWNRLDEDGRQVLRTVASNHLRPWSSGNDIDPPISEWQTREYVEREYAEVIRTHLTSPLARVERIILQMSDRLREPYSFQYYAPGTINFGILQTWRQQWVPDTYQVGRLVSTLPLAPGEKRSFKVKQTVKKSRAQKEIEKALTERSREAQQISRAELEVMARTTSSTNFRMTAQGSISLGVGSVSSSSEFGMNQSNEASRTKKAFDEATRKSAEKVRQEREIHVERSESAESEAEATHEISNPNNEVTVTYLLYELERRYLLSTALQQVQPVVLVALDIPAPHEISETWMLEHAWILRRCLLDDRLQDGLAALEGGTITSDEMDVEIKKTNWTTQKRLVERLEADLGGLLELRELRRQRMISLREQVERAQAGESDADDVAAAIFSGGLSLLFGGGATPDRSELLEAQRKSVEQVLEYMDQQIEELQGQLSRAQAALQSATEEYSAALKRRERTMASVREMQLNFRQNILYYMHNIWDATDPDQRALSLQNVEVRILEPAMRTCRLRRATEEERAADMPRVLRDGVDHVVECEPPRAPRPGEALPTRTATLSEIADLDRPLGYKGNYIVFPLKECTYLTDLMLQEFIDDYFGVRDPDNPDGYSSEELLRYASELWHDPDVALTDEERAALRALVLRKLTDTRADRQVVVLPTGNLYMEALKGEQTLLEDFKLAHRGLDVIKVEEEIRQARLENLRRVARLTGTEPDLEQPTADRVVIVKGATDLSMPIGDEG